MLNKTYLINRFNEVITSENKTYSENHLPNIREDLIRHFIRGYFDGDGTVSGSYKKPDLK